MKSAQCLTCLNLWETAEVPACTAFPLGIPEEIATGEVDHSEPYAGDHDIRYEPRKQWP